MTIVVASSLAVITAALIVIEQRRPLTLRLSFRGDLNRETMFLAQYGQSVATPLAGLLVTIARRWDWRYFVLVCLPVLAAGAACMVVKRLCGRMRPNRENAGRFTGPDWRHSSKRESFPSSHSACAMGLSVSLAHVWPEAAGVFWGLAAITAILRYLNDAHFPSDIVGGTLLGLCVAQPLAHVLEDALRI